MAKGEHMRATMADLAGQDTELMAHCCEKAMAGDSGFAVALGIPPGVAAQRPCGMPDAVLRAQSTLLRLGASAMQDDELEQAAGDEGGRRRA